MSDQYRPHRNTLDIPLHERAADLVVVEGEWFARILVTEAKVRADMADLDQVSVTHIRNASIMLTDPDRRRPEVKEAMLFFTGLVSGVFWPFLVSEARAEHPSIGWLVFFGLGSGIGVMLACAVLWMVLSSFVFKASDVPATHATRPSSDPS